MSHFSVCVAIPSCELRGMEVDEDIIERGLSSIMAPYDENQSDPQYLEFRETSEDEKDEDGQSGYYFNPNAKWDWYQIGGRFSSRLLADENAPDCLLSENNAFYTIPDYTFADGGRKGSIAWDKMRSEAEKSVAKTFEKLKCAFETGNKDDLGPLAVIKENGIYGWDGLIYQKGETLDAYRTRLGLGDSDQYALDCYAYVDKNGQWNASGDMGWFGISSNDKEERAWHNEVQAFLKELEDDDYIVMLDCHI